MTEPSAAPPRIEIFQRDLGRMRYSDALDLQRQLQREVIAERAEGQVATRGYLLLVEHDPPVITVSRRRTARQHLVATDEALAAAGVEVAETDRGGDITYHGPGQLVVYPIVDLNAINLRLHSYMRFLEDIVIDTLGHFGIEGTRDPDATGVWVPRKTAAGARQFAKICAMGVRLSRWVSMHGLALNVTTNLDHFNLIVPCGLAGRPVTSMRAILGEACPALPAVKKALADRFIRRAQANAMGSDSACRDVTQ